MRSWGGISLNSSHFTITVPHAVYESLSIVKRSSSTTLSTHTKLWILSASPISHYRIPPPGESSKDNIHEMSEGSAYHHTNTMTVDDRSDVTAWRGRRQWKKFVQWHWDMTLKTSWVQLSSRNGLESYMKIRRVHWVAKSWKNRNSINGKRRVCQVTE